MGYLSGSLDANTTLDAKTDLRSGFERFTAENMAANMPIVELLKRFAAKKNATPSQLALAWLLAQRPFIVPIHGTRNMNHLQENLGALNIKLTPKDLTDLEAEFSTLTVHGGRMNKMQMEYVDTTA
jgi:aryl-alcohol dehydrogenase-like predicted oxidoreductase